MSSLCRHKSKFRRDSRSGIGDVFLEGGQWNLALDTLSLRLSTQVNVHDVASEGLQTDKH